jgi:metallopeptidase MepB
LIHREVVTLLHELGHGIHDLVSKTIYSRFHGTNTVIDFGEAPSQMLENWCWEPSSLKTLSRHYSSLSLEYFKAWEEQAEGKSKPPEKILNGMIESLIGAKHVNGALSNLNQLHLGIFDMMVHEPESHEAIEKLNISARYNTLRTELLQINGPEVLGQGDEWGHGQANFGHLMGDYDVGYYGYLRQDPLTRKRVSILRDMT